MFTKTYGLILSNESTGYLKYYNIVGLDMSDATRAD